MHIPLEKKTKKKLKFIFLFMAMLVLIGVYYSFFIISGRIPAGHDTFLDLSIKYYFANNAVETGVFPQWFPFVSNGTVAAPFFPTQCGFIQSLLPLLGGLLKGEGYLKFFYIDYLLKEIIFILGAWLWSRVFIQRTLAKIFFVLTLDASFCWFTQPHFNCNLIYALPLILYAGHAYLSSGKVIFLLFFGEMLFISSIMAPVYFLPLTTFIVFLYFIIYICLSRPNLSEWNHSLRKYPLSHFGAVIVIAASFGIFFLFIQVGMTDMMLYQPGRSASGSNSLADFLQYGSNISVGKWIEYFIPFSPELDYSLYSGYLAPFFLICGILSSNNKRRWIVILILLLTDFTIGGITARLAYYIWPLMKYYRHLALASPVIKLFLGLLAAIGFEFLINKFSLGDKGSHKRLAFGLLFWGICLWLLFTLLDVPTMLDFAHRMTPQTLAVKEFCALWIPTIEHKSFFYGCLSFLTALLALLIFLTRDQKKIKVCLYLLIIIIFIDVVSYKITEGLIRTTKLPASQLKILNFTSIPYPERRKANLWGFERSAIFQTLSLQTVMYEESSLLVFADEPGATFRLTMWLRPRDEYWRLFWGQQPFDTSKPPRGLNEYANVVLPSDSDVANKLSGLTKDKIQFFSKVLYAEPQSIVTGMLSPQYAGDIPLVQSGISYNMDSSSLNYNARENLVYEIMEFSSDKIVIDVRAPQEKTYLYYSDTWDKRWKAFVNNRAETILKSNLANKVVALDKGINRVVLTFSDPFILFFYYFTQINFIFAAIWIPVFLFHELKRKALH